LKFFIVINCKYFHRDVPMLLDSPPLALALLEDATGTKQAFRCGLLHNCPNRALGSGQGIGSAVEIDWRGD
jgi:hypothetical protein